MSNDEPKVKDSKPAAKVAAAKTELLDPFIAQDTYPDPAAVFTSKPIALSDAQQTAHIVLDTNALLVPYGIGGDTLAQIEATYKRLIREERLAIPAQVAREFARNRVTKLAELHQKLSRKRSQLPTFQQGTYPMLEAFDDYKTLRELERDIDRLIATYRSALGNVIEHVKSWEWNDPVSLLYARLFPPSIIVDTSRARSAIETEHVRRFAHKIPPGYKDEPKDDQGIGDFLIWLTILEIATKRQKSVIFVSGEEKADWWHRSEGQGLYPRFELVDEFRRHSGGLSFHIVKFSQFLGLFGASEAVVAEVREEEAAAAIVAPPLSFHAEQQSRAMRAEMSVASWLMSSGYEVTPAPARAPFDYIAKGSNGHFGVDVLYIRGETNIRMRIRHHVERSRLSSPSLPVVVVVASESSAVLQAAEKFWVEIEPTIRLATGLVTQDGKFMPVRGIV